MRSTVLLFTWTHPDGGVTSVSFAAINRSTAGKYRCNAANEINTLTEILAIVVHYPPQLQLKVSSDVMVEGDSVAIICRADDRAYKTISP